MINMMARMALILHWMLNFAMKKKTNIYYLKSQTVKLCTMIQIKDEEIINIVHSFVRNNIICPI